MTDAEIAKLLEVADRALETAQSAHAMIADELLRRTCVDYDHDNVDTTPEPALVPSDDPALCQHPTQLHLAVGISICEDCGTNLRADGSVVD